MTQITSSSILLFSLFGGSIMYAASSTLDEDPATTQFRKTISTTHSTVSTTTVDCSDTPGMNCAKLRPQCADASYDDIMDKYCRKTCNRCFVTTCYDATESCVTWNKNGFCNSTFYTPEQKKEYCEKTCGFCK